VSVVGFEVRCEGTWAGQDKRWIGAMEVRRWSEGLACDWRVAFNWRAEGSSPGRRSEATHVDAHTLNIINRSGNDYENGFFPIALT